MIVTTTYKPTIDLVNRAKEAAKRLLSRYEDRGRLSIVALQEQYNQLEVLVFGEKEIKLYTGEETPRFFHPSTAMLRIKRLLNGEKDALIEAAGVQAGDIVLDCTAGLGSDAIVFSFAAGSEGKVKAVESSRLQAFLLEEGLVSYKSGLPLLDESMRRIEVIRSEHFEVLHSLPSQSIDIVYFDPMFRSPIESSSAIGTIRTIANVQPITVAAVQQAIRVARKRIILKERRESTEFARLGFQKKAGRNAPILYGVIEKS